MLSGLGAAANALSQSLAGFPEASLEVESLRPKLEEQAIAKRIHLEKLREMADLAPFRVPQAQAELAFKRGQLGTQEADILSKRAQVQNILDEMRRRNVKTVVSPEGATTTVDENPDSPTRGQILTHTSAPERPSETLARTTNDIKAAEAELEKKRQAAIAEYTAQEQAAGRVPTLSGQVNYLNRAGLMSTHDSIAALANVERIDAMMAKIAADADRRDAQRESSELRDKLKIDTYLKQARGIAERELERMQLTRDQLGYLVYPGENAKERREVGEFMMDQQLRNILPTLSPLAYDEYIKRMPVPVPEPRHVKAYLKFIGEKPASGPSVFSKEYWFGKSDKNTSPESSRGTPTPGKGFASGPGLTLSAPDRSKFDDVKDWFETNPEKPVPVINNPMQLRMTLNRLNSEIDQRAKQGNIKVSEIRKRYQELELPPNVIDVLIKQWIAKYGAY